MTINRNRVRIVPCALAACVLAGLASTALAGGRNPRRAMSLDGKASFPAATGAPAISGLDEGTDTPTIADIPTFEQNLDATLPSVGNFDAFPRVFGNAAGEIALLALDDFRLVARRSTDGGATFGAEVRLGGATPPDVFEYEATRSSDGKLYVAMIVADPTGGLGVRSTRSDDMGATWTDPVTVVAEGDLAHGVLGVRIAAGPAGTAAIAMRGNLGNDPFVSATADGGATWTSPVRIDAGIAAGASFLPAVDVAIDNGSRIHAVFAQDRGANPRVFYSKSTDGGATFSPEVQVPLPSAGYSANPDLAVANDGNLLLTLWDYSDVDRVYVLRSTDQGGSFTTALSRLAANTGQILRPNLAVDAATATAFVHYVDGNGTLQLERTLNSGATWGSLLALVTSTAVGYFDEFGAEPNVFMRRTTGTTWVIAWTDRRSDTYARLQTDVYARATTNDGGTFGAGGRVDSGTVGSAASRLTGMTAHSANNVFFAYSDGRDETNRSDNVYGNRSAIPLSFGTDARLDTDPGVTTPDVGVESTVATDGAGHVYYAFRARDTGPYDDIHVAVSADSGATFGAPLRVGSVAAGSRLNRNPIVRAFPDGRVYLLYQSDTASSTREFRITRSSDFGATWSSPDIVVGSISATAGSVDDINTAQRLEATSAGVVYVIWSNSTDIFMARSIDFGATFAAPVAIDGDPSGAALFPLVCASGTRLILSYGAYNSAGTQFSVYARVSDDSGATFGARSQLRDNAQTGSLYYYDMACGPNGTASVTWPEDRPGPAQIFSSRFDGTSWSAESLASTPTGQWSYVPDAEFVDASTVLVAYEDELQRTIHVSRSTDGGATFPSFVRVDDALPAPGASSYDARLAADAAGRVWVRFRDNTSGLPAVVARVSTDGGLAFGPALRLNRELPQGSRFNQEIANFPLGRDIAASSGIAYFAWTAPRAAPTLDALYNFWDSGDLDRDGEPAGTDCDDQNADVRLAPVEVAGVALGKIAGGTRIAWTSQDASAGPATVYDLVTGVLADLRGSRDFSAAWCLAGGVADTPYDDLSADPPEGSGRYVLVRGSNACGNGTHGDSTLPTDPRDGLDSGSPCP